MKRLTLAVSIAAVLVLTESAEAQRGHGAGGPAGPPAMSQRDQMPDRSGKPGKESGLSGAANREQHGQSNLTVGDRLAKNTHLAAHLQGLFPAGTDLQQASSGFKNLGQFVAAAHVSKNLGIPFDQLKAKMTGISSSSPNSAGDSPVSLGKAIHELRPQVDAKSEVKRAEVQAKEDVKDADAARKEGERKTEQSGT
jgi:hypothetical protein